MVSKPIDRSNPIDSTRDSTRTTRTREDGNERPPRSIDRARGERVRRAWCVCLSVCLSFVDARRVWCVDADADADANVCARARARLDGADRATRTRA